MVDALDGQYKRANKQVVFIEWNVDDRSNPRRGRWNAAYTGGPSITLPLWMVDSGFRWGNARQDFERVYRAAVDEALARPLGVELEAYYQRTGNTAHVTARVKNVSGHTLGYTNRATVWALIYEDRRVIHTGRYGHSAVQVNVSPDLPEGETATFELEVRGGRGMNWSKTHIVVLVDYVPPASTGNAFDMLQAAVAIEGVPPTEVPEATPVPPDTPVPTVTNTPIPMDTAVPTPTKEPTPTEVPVFANYLPIVLRGNTFEGR